MVSEKPISREEFVAKVKEFAQQIANRIPGADVSLMQDPLVPRAVIISVQHEGKSQHTQLLHARDGLVEMHNILGEI
ncbi:hypothetical protein [Serratia phage X20]|uniref:DUF7320 domain-containing protein n=1 Tax=Serratia phage X20 TaxID=2006942 RepID=A0A1Z1LZH1_9CAUD|nr:hypothetical protein KNT72_gp191 [Serratia phage X20]ARW58197.1 hypothetical protein [Serratia phage X20]QYN80664.1 hypothetical protein [Kosakonia phage Kc304]UJJ22212.1 hypothetical protein [Erwinia phage Virsaitis27]